MLGINSLLEITAVADKIERCSCFWLWLLAYGVMAVEPRKISHVSKSCLAPLGWLYVEGVLLCGFAEPPSLLMFVVYEAREQNDVGRGI